MERWRARFDATLRRHIRPGQRLAVAVSGGPDSQALLHLIAAARTKLGVGEVVALGVDHGLRPEARDELALANALADELGVPFVTLPVQVARHGNLLAAARRARYQALLAHARSTSLDWILVGHTATDQLETVLMRLARGTGLAGVSGIRRRRGRLLRPLLDASRGEILAYCSTHHLAFARDPSNEDPRRARAILRAHVVPGLRTLGFDLERSVRRFTSLARADEQWLERHARMSLETCRGPLGSIVIATLLALPHAMRRRVLRRWLMELRLPGDSDSVHAVLHCARKKRSTLTLGGEELHVEHGHLWPPMPAAYDIPVRVPGRTEIAPLGIALEARIEEIESDPQILARTQAAHGRLVAFDAERTHFDLRVRSWKQGDRLEPFGLRGHTKVGDLFTDRKIPTALRHIWPLVLDGEELLWVVGLRRGTGAPVRPQTKRALTLAIDGPLPWGAPPR